MFFLQMSGFPGSGKSTLAKEVSHRLHDTVIVDHDIVKTALLEAISIENDINIGKVSYQLEWDLIENYISQGLNVIHDSPCIYHELLEKGIQLAEKYLFQYKFIDCVVKDMNIINKRLKTRKRKRSQIPETSEEYYQVTLNSTQYPSSNYLVVNSDSPVESYIDTVIEYLKKQSTIINRVNGR